TTSRYLEQGVCVPLWVLRDDPLMHQAGVSFTQATPPERQAVAEQLERLARTRVWGGGRETIGSLYPPGLRPPDPGTPPWSVPLQAPPVGAGSPGPTAVGAGSPDPAPGPTAGLLLPRVWETFGRVGGTVRRPCRNV